MKSKIITVFALMIGLFGQSLAYSQPVMAVTFDSKNAACEGVGGATGNVVAGTNACDAEAGKVSSVVRTAIRVFQVIVGLIAIFYLIYGGLKFITSTGSSDGVKAGRNTIIYSAIGLIIVMIAEGIVQFVLKRFE